ncbi:erythromycin esterase family protein [uncultured Acetobacteroides sp.]|uniref:erythromycin esterase family protein n=1 Tax=uncultured Acetobacteroides sp. TaxID=1760811 RepID=UPI0029F4E0E2|nr:erythromycin esterase family protein [uncultured Acetobacteroides sp.]
MIISGNHNSLDDTLKLEDTKNRWQQRAHNYKIPPKTTDLLLRFEAENYNSFVWLTKPSVKIDGKEYLSEPVSIPNTVQEENQAANNPLLNTTFAAHSSTKIVAFGETIHYTNELIAKILASMWSMVKSGNTKLLLFELSPAECYLANLYVNGTIDKNEYDRQTYIAKHADYHTSHLLLSKNGFLDSIRYYNSKNIDSSITIAGIDLDMPDKELLQNIFNSFPDTCLTTLKAKINSCQKTSIFDTLNPQKAIITALNRININNCSSFWSSYLVSTSRNIYNLGTDLDDRDYKMFANAKLLIERFSRGKQVAIYAHWCHATTKKNTAPWVAVRTPLGYHLSKEFGSAYRTIALCGGSGIGVSMNSNGNPYNYKIEKPEKGSLENYLYQYKSPECYIDFTTASIPSSVKYIRILGNTSRIGQFIPIEEAGIPNAVIFVRDITPIKTYEYIDN